MLADAREANKLVLVPEQVREVLGTSQKADPITCAAFFHPW